MNAENRCPHFKTCPGCSEWAIDLNSQLESKKSLVFSLLDQHLLSSSIGKNCEVFSVGPGHHRVWFDLQLSPLGLGLNRKQLDNQHKIEPISECYLMSEDLKILFKKFQKFTFPDRKISARLRVSPENKYGLWLDMANTDVKDLLVEKVFLKSLSELFTKIEIGQKRKILNTQINEVQYKLTDPELFPWFQTQKTVLHSYIGSFTQPSWFSADFITGNILKWSEGSQRITEFGSGIGQYTIPLLQNKFYVTVFENNPLATEALIFNAQKYSNFLQLNPQTRTVTDLYLVNPPRSGLGDFVHKIKLSGVKKIIYISCAIDSLKKDLDVLQPDYKISDLKIVDQFPNSKHFETCVFLEKQNESYLSE